jgi:PAS domain S-box-containing protein
MALSTAIGFLLIGSSQLTPGLRTSRGHQPSQWLALAAGGLGLTAVLGYVYGVIPLVGVGQGIQIAMHTAVALVALAIGVLTSDLHSGWMRTLLSRGAGGVLVRRLLPFAFFTPLLLALLRPLDDLLALRALSDSSATVAVATMVAIAVVVWRTAAVLDATEQSWQTAERDRLQLSLREQAAQARVEAERKAREVAERAVHEKEEALSVLDLVLSSTPVGFALLDDELRYLRINAALAALNGKPAEAHIGRKVRDVLPETADTIEPVFLEVLSTGVPVINAEQTETFPGTPGQERHWLASIYPVRSKPGDVIGLGVMVIDETERHRLQAQLRQSQKMEAVGQLAGGIAHDFNNLLTVVLSYSQMLVMDLEPDDPNRALAKEIEAAAVRAGTLTRQLLAFSRQQVLQPRILDVNTTVRGMEKMLQRLVMSDVAIEMHLDPSIGLVHVDEGQLEQVLMNLAANARDAMPKGGTVTIATQTVDLDHGYVTGHGPAEVAPGAYVMLTVSDTGVGMPAAVRARIFDPFFTTKEPGKGTGLGLSMVYGIVRQSRGYIWCYSEPGLGTTFRIYLPRAAGTADTSRRRTPTGQATPAGEHIVVVEDDDALRLATKRFLERSGYVVTVAASGAEALRLIESAPTPVDLVITDVIMPEMNGRELAERLRERYPTLRMLLTSGFTQSALLRDQILTDGTAFLEKPYELSTLARRLRELLDRGTAGDLQPR